MKPFLALIHSTDVGRSWYGPLWIRAVDEAAARTEAEERLKGFRAAGDHRGQGIIGSVCEVPPEVLVP